MLVSRRETLGGLAATLIGLKRPAMSAETGTSLTLEAGPGQLQLVGKQPTAVWAFNGQVPGPLLRIRRGDRLRVRLVNKLDQPATLCWRGVRIDNAMDGVAGLTQPAVPPGGTFDYAFTPPDSGFFWYHPHAWPFSAEQVGRGLYGPLIVDEPEPPAVDEDLVVVLDDWALDGGGQIKGGFAPSGGCAGDRVGSLLTAGSRSVPERRTLQPGARIRLRLLNACSARIAIVSLTGVEPTVIAVDGQPSEPFKPARGTVPLGPGARFEMIFDLPARPAPDTGLVLRGGTDGPDQPLLHFEIAGQALPAKTTPARLPENPRLPTRIPLERSLKRDLVIAAAAPPPARNEAAAAHPTWCLTLDGRGSDGFSGPPLFKVKQGQAVTLAVINRTGVAQQMHVHGHVFRVLHDLDDGWDPFWRDSVLVAPNRTKHIAFIADNPGRWAVDSSMLARQVEGLAGYFLVEAVRMPQR